jgi:predicted transcriptional regulator
MDSTNRLDSRRSTPTGQFTAVGDFQGPLSPKHQKLVDEIERIYLSSVEEYGEDPAYHPKILIYTK